MLFQPILALDTSAGASACLIQLGEQVATATMQTPRAHSRELLPMLQGLLDEQGVGWQDIQAFAVGVGPGSFTGLRVACAMIAGINASLQKPVYSLSSLAITARQTNTSERFWAIEDARSGLVYAAQFEGDECISQPQCLAWEDFLKLKPSLYISLSDIPVELQGWSALDVSISREQALTQAVHAISSDTSYTLWAEPMYLQASQAEKNLA